MGKAKKSLKLRDWQDDIRAQRPEFFEPREQKPLKLVEKQTKRPVVTIEAEAKVKRPGFFWRFW